MMKFLCSTICALFFIGSAQAQTVKETNAYFELLKDIVSSESYGAKLVYRLDTLKAKFIPSRSHVTDSFNRDVDFGFKQRNLKISLNFAAFHVELLCRNDTIYLVSLSSYDYKSIRYNNFEKDVIVKFLKERNKFYGSSKTPQQLINEISLPEEYAFYCGDGMPKTEKGKDIEQWVDDENAPALIDMLKSFNCEIQAYGVPGLEMLEKRDYEIPYSIHKLISYIKKRNSEVVVCSGCLRGVIEKIY